MGMITDLNYESSPVTNTLVIAPARDFGVDVSHFQNESGIPQFSWDQMFAEGKRFVFVKATEGLTGPHDPAMALNVQRAAAAGLLVGVYHFAHPENRPTTNGAILEASNMVVYASSAIGPGRLRPVLDLEFNAATLSATELTDWAIAFCDEIVARRGPSAAPIIYCNQSFANNEFDSRLANYDLWLRTVGSGANPVVDSPPGQGFVDATGIFNNWSFWQYSATGSSGGINPLDLNVCHSDFKPLNSFLISNAVPVAILLIGSFVNANSAFQFNFTNPPGTSFTVLVATNVAVPLSNWTTLGAVTETSSGQYQFTDPQTTNYPQRYYRVRSP
jgi:GH25 family lysozyme M1 (1,4-beta-N-acetylmuramidase)